MKVSKEKIQQIDVLKVDGDIDLYNAPSLKEEINDFLKDGKHRIILDTHNSPLIDSSGLAVLLHLAFHFSETKNKLRIVVNKQNVSIFKFFSLDKKAILFTSQQSALDSFLDEF